MVYQAYGGMSNSTGTSGDQNRKIFLGGLNYHTTDDTLRTFCASFGKITDCLVMRNPEGKSRGFGFVTYEDTQSVEDFMRARPHTIDNRQIDPKRAMPREEQNSSEAHLTVKKLFVAGLREGINEENLRAHFSRFGNIVEILVMKDREGKPRGFAFVTYDDYDAVDKAVLEKPHVINGRNLDVKKAVPKEKMQDNSGLDSSPGASGGMPSYNRSSSSNYSGSTMGGGGPPSSNSQRNNYGQMRDDYNSSPNAWGGNQGGGMGRMNSQNQNYNQPPASSYGPQGGYNTSVSSYNQSMPPTNSYSQQYNPMGQSQPPPPPSMPQQQSSMMNYDMYSNNNPNMSYNNQPTPPSSSSYMQPPQPQSYGQSQQQGYGSNSSSYVGMNSPFNALQAPSSVGSGSYSNPSSSASPFDTNSSYRIPGSGYGSGPGAGGSTAGSYNSMPQQQSRGGGPMRNGRGGGNNNYGGSAGNEGNYGSRPGPYTSRGAGRGGGRGGRGHGRGQ